MRHWDKAIVVEDLTDCMIRNCRVDLDDNGVVVINTPDGETICTHISNVTITIPVATTNSNGHIHCTICDELVPTAEYSTHLADFHQLPF